MRDEGTRLAVSVGGQAVEIPNLRDLDFTSGGPDCPNFPIVAAFPRADRALNNAALIVDPDADDAAVAARALRQVGFRAVVESGAREAALHLRKLGPPALLVVALEAPRIVELVRNVRSRPRMRDVAVIYHTRRIDAPDVERALRSGPDAYVVKTPGAQSLVDAVRTVFGR